MNTPRILHPRQRLTNDELAARCKGLPPDRVVALGCEQITPDTLASLMGYLADEPTRDRISALYAFADRITTFATELRIAIHHSPQEKQAA